MCVKSARPSSNDGHLDILFMDGIISPAPVNSAALASALRQGPGRQ